jgi:hypothetical protein
MANTKYDLPNSKGSNLISLSKDNDTYSINSKKSNASKYKKYGIKDYNNMQHNIKN